MANWPKCVFNRPKLCCQGETINTWPSCYVDSKHPTEQNWISDQTWVRTGVRSSQRRPGSIPTASRRERLSCVGSTNSSSTSWLRKSRPTLCGKELQSFSLSTKRPERVSTRSWTSSDTRSRSPAMTPTWGTVCMGLTRTWWCLECAPTTHTSHSWEKRSSLGERRRSKSEQ